MGMVMGTSKSRNIRWLLRIVVKTFQSTPYTEAESLCIISFCHSTAKTWRSNTGA